ncbi:IS1 family transposase [Escherichia coli]
MTDGWLVDESLPTGKQPARNQRETYRTDWHNLNLGRPLDGLGGKSLRSQNPVELHDKVIGHYLNIKHYQ